MKNLYRRCIRAFLSGLLAYFIFYIAPDLLIRVLSFENIAGVNIEDMLDSIIRMEDIGWGFVMLAVASPLLKGTRLSGLFGSLTSAYVAYLV